eukprot:scaffold46131_cov29-Phaeocystis_antarctica.AAC.3
MGAARLWLTADWSRHGYSNDRGENNTECVCLCAVEPAACDQLWRTHIEGQARVKAEQSSSTQTGEKQAA